MKKVTQCIIKDVPDVPYALAQLNKLLCCVESDNWDHTEMDPHRGLCSNIDICDLNEIMLFWPNHSGSYTYPVKSGYSYMTPKEMFRLSSSSNTSKYVGAYGKRRINLLKWLIKQFEIAVVEINKL